jgi:hypothetical protein
MKLALLDEELVCEEGLDIHAYTIHRSCISNKLTSRPIKGSRISRSALIYSK